MRRFLFLAFAAVLSLPAGGQVPDAVIVSHLESFTLNSPQSGVYKVSAEVLVNKEDGLFQAVPLIYTDSFRSIASFSGEVESGGRKVKFGKKDLNTVSISTGLTDDSFVSSYQPSGQYPLTVHYEYSVNYRNGVLSFPVFSPLQCENVLVQSATYRLDLPAGTEIVSYSGHTDQLPVSEVKGRIIHEWQVKDFQPIRREPLMPPMRELIPVVYAAPRSFSYAGTTGTQADWKEYGLWLGRLAEGTGALPAKTVESIRNLTKDCSTDLDKLRVLYKLLREKTRYVAIELGTGKLKPIAAAEVDESGFGDCKALSNYLCAMLEAVGVPSSYYIISTDKKDLLPSFTSAGQMNHAMLAVPLRETGDTVFVECTNPSVPLGYRHEDVAGHEILLIEPEGGKLVRVGTYPDSLRRCGHRSMVTLSRDGSASIEVCSRYSLNFAEPFFDWESIKPERRVRMLTEGFRIHPNDIQISSVSDNFGNYEGYSGNFCPEKTINFCFTSPKYARAEGKRLFVPLNPESKRFSIQKTARVNEITIPEGYSYADTMIVRLPAGYSVESIPEDVALDLPWASFRSTSKLQGDCIVTVQTLTFKPSRSDKSTYPQFRDFARKVNRCYDASVVFTSE